MPDNPEAYLTKGYASNTSVYSIVDRVDKMRKQARLRLMRRTATGKEEVTNHELLRFLRKVNPSMTTDDYISAYLIYRMVVGENFTYRVILDAGLNKGKVNELHILPASEVEIIEGGMFEPVRGYRVEGSYNIEFDLNQVHHSKMFNPNWFEERSLHGMSPLRAAARTVSLLNEAEITNLKQLENQSPPYLLFKDTKSTQNGSFQSALTPEQQEETEKLVSNHAKSKKRGLPLVLRESFGKIDLGKSLSDLSVLETSKNGIIALCAVYGLPPELFGYGQKTYNNMGTARKSAWTDCIIPNLDKFAKDFTSCLIDDTPFESENLYFDFDLSDVEELSEGMKDKVDWMRNAHWSINQILEATGKPRVDDPNADQPILAMSDTFLSDIGVSLGGQKDWSDYIPEEK